MGSDRSFDAFLEDVFARTGMFVLKRDYDLVSHFIAGADYALANVTENSVRHLDGFQEWLDLYFGTKEPVFWTLRAVEGANTDEEKIERLHKFLTDFRRDAREKGVDAIRQEHQQRFGPTGR